MAALRSEWMKARGELVAKGEDLSSQLEAFTQTKSGTSLWSQTLDDVTEMISEAELQMAEKESATERHSVAVAKIASLRTGTSLHAISSNF